MSKSVFAKKHSALYLAGALSLPLLALSLLFYYRPFWGVMDDSTNLVIAESMRNEGIFPVWWKLSTTDLFAHGRLRSLYYAMLALIYVPAGASSETAFAINIVFLAGIFFVSAYAFWFAARDAFALTNRHAFYFAFVTLSFAYPWTVHAIRAPSVHEKIVLLFSALVLIAQYRLQKLPLLPWILAVGLVVGVSIHSKETIALFFPLFLTVQLHLDHAKGSYRRTAGMFIFLIAASLLIKWAGTHGSYKAAYGLDRATQTLLNSKSLYLFLLLAVGAGLVAIIDFFRHRNLTRFFLAASFPTGLLLFLVIMLPWGLGGYLNCSATLFVVMCVIGIFKFARERVPALATMPMLFFASLSYLSAFAMIWMQLGKDYSTYSDFRRILFSEELATVAKEGKTLWMPCNEGSGTVEHYLKRFRDITLITRMPDPKTSLVAGEYWLFSQGNCSGDQDIAGWIAQGEAETVIASRRNGGYTLVRRLKSP